MDTIKDTRLPFTKSPESDVCIVIDDCEFHLNKNLLTNKSSFFEAMFNRNWRESSQSKEGQPIYLSELDSDLCRTIFHYLYTNRLLLPGVTDDSMFFTKFHEVIAIAQYFGIEEDIEIAMGHFLRKLLTKHTVFRIWEITYFSGTEALSSVCEKWLIQNFHVACEVFDFFFCSRELLRRILCGGEIDCEPDLILEKLKLWARFNLYREQNVPIQSEMAEKKYLMDLLPPQTLFSKTIKRAILGF